MRPLKAVLLGAGLLVAGLNPLRAEYLSRGFEVMPTFYQPRDSRFWGEGVDFGFNLKVADRFTMGGRFEYMNARGVDSIPPPAVPPNTVVVTGDAVFLGVTAFYRLAEMADRTLGTNLGLWAGGATSSQFGPTGMARMSPFIEPMAQATYGLGPNKSAQLKVGVGYRFIRNFPAINNPFFLGSSPVKDFDGLDVQLGVGYSF